MLSGTTQLVFFFPLFLTSVPAEEGKQGWQEGSGEEVGLGAEACIGGGGPAPGIAFFPTGEGDAVSSAADLSFLLCFPFPLGTAVLELL